MTEEQLSALLRLKRYEKPPEGYFEQLLEDIHRRQRAELLQRSVWRIAIDRVQAFFAQPAVGTWGYAGAVATVLVGGVFTLLQMQPVENESASRAIAQTSPASQLAPATSPTSRILSLDGSAPALAPVSQAQEFPTTRSRSSFTAHAPRYVIDARPASYEPSFNF